MKKVFFILLSILIIAFTPGLAMASDDIRIFVNGTQVFSDVPPQLIGGRTMVPIRAVSEALGAGVNWNDSTRTVEITKNETDNSEVISNEVINNDPTGNELNNTELLELYTKIADHYHNLGQLNDQFIDAARKLDYAKCRWPNNSKRLDEISDKLDDIIDSCESIRRVNQKLVSEANAAGIDITDTNEILLRYDNAIFQYKRAKNSYRIYNNDKYINYVNMGFDESKAGAHKALEGYNRFYNLIQEF